MRQLLIFLKYPTPGQVKTRLAEDVGEQAAAEIYRACAQIVLERCRGLRRETVLCVDPPEALERTRAWLGRDWSLLPQCGGTLGERLGAATREAFSQGATQVVIVGTDSPWLQRADVEAAFAALERADLVLGPTEDGGYYLIGLAREVIGVFEGIAWSTDQVYAQTLARAQALGLRIRALARGYDIDRMADVWRFLADEQGRGASPSLLAAYAGDVHHA